MQALTPLPKGPGCRLESKPGLGFMQGTLAVLLAWDGGNLARSAENGRFPISWNGLVISLGGPPFLPCPHNSSKSFAADTAVAREECTVDRGGGTGIESFQRRTLNICNVAPSSDTSIPPLTPVLPLC